MRGPTTVGVPSVPGLPAQGPTASGDAAWSVSRSLGGKGSKACEPLQAAGLSETSGVGTGPIAQFPFPRTRPALYPQPDTCDHRQLPMAETKGFLEDDWEPASFPQTKTDSARCEQTPTGPGLRCADPDSNLLPPPARYPARSRSGYLAGPAPVCTLVGQQNPVPAGTQVCFMV